MYEYRRWRDIDPEIRPSFAEFLSRTTPVAEMADEKRAVLAADDDKAHADTETDRT